VFRSSSLLTTGISVDDVVLTNEPWSQREDSSASATRLTMTGGPTSRQISFPGCPRECWFVFGESHNLGWTAHLDGVDLGTPQQVNGGFNGWLLPAGAEAGSITLQFRPQRWLTAGLLITAFTVVAMIIVVMRGTRKRSSGHDVILAAPRSQQKRPSSNHTPSLVFFLIAGAVTVALVSQPVYFIPACMVLALIWRNRNSHWPRFVLVMWSLSGLGLGLLRILITDPPIRFDWTHETAAVHWHLLASTALIAIITNLPSSPSAKSGFPA